jgi:hypothetical protein
MTANSARAVEASGAPFKFEAPLAEAVPYKINMLKAERFQIYREQSSMFAGLDRQTRELELLRKVAEGHGLEFKDYINAPQSLSGAVLYLGTVVAGSVMKKRMPQAFVGSLSVGEVAFTATALGGAAWSLYEIADHQRMLNHLKSMRLEDLEKIHKQKADEYNRDLAIYNQMHEAMAELSKQIKALEQQVN